MKINVKGSMTICLSLSMVLFLSFCMVLLEGARIYFLRMETAQAMELTEFSVLSEFQIELFQSYGLFFLDLDYEQGKEQTAILEKRAEKYLSENATECTTLDIAAEKFIRATDGEGNPFFMQAVEQMKVQSGYKLFEELVEFVDGGEQLDVSELLEEQEAKAQNILHSSAEENGIPEIEIALPRFSFPSIKALTEAVFGNLEGLSGKSVDLEERILNRVVKKGSGTKENVNFSQMQMFHAYILNYCNYYGNKKGEICKEVLEYQVEYIISGQNNDRENLENVMWRIFLLRAGGNYLFYHQDAKKLMKAEAEALAIASALANPELVTVVKDILLITQAIASAIDETKAIFAGERVPLYQEGVFCNLELGYEEYLYLLLNTTGKKEKIYRCMDVVELEVRKKSGYDAFCLDHCTDCFTLVWNYEFESLFLSIPLIDQNTYENTIIKKVFYEN